MPDPEGTRKLEAILAADVAGYSRLMQEDDEATVGTLETYRGIFRERVQTHHGRIVDMAGDSVLAVFDAATGAVRAAFEIQSEIARHNEALPEARRMRFRIGVNIGEVIERSNGTVYGDGVNIAARLETMGEPGGITISGAVYDQVTRIRAEFDCVGEQKVKNIADPIRVYRVKSLPAYPLRPASAEGQGATRSPALALPDKPSIAVLPFLNMSGDKEQEYFSDGMTEDIITALTRFIKLSVVARNSSFVYKGRAVDVREVGKQLGVRYVLEGSVRRSQDRVRITAQLIDASDGKHIWAESYDRELKDLFGVQDEVTRHIVGRLDVELDRAQLDEAKRASPKDFRAYDLVLQARRQIYDMSETNHRESRDLLERAIAMDHQLAPAYMGLAWVYLDEYRCGWNARPGSLDRALKAAQRAVELE